MTTEEIIKANQGIRLDIGCGANKNAGFLGMDARDLPGVDIVWDVTKFPWPLPDECAFMATASHLLEHIPPFQADPKLLGLIQLLLDRGIIGKEDVADYIGEYNSMPMFLRFMDEVWRILKPGGQFLIAVPHGRSNGFLQDPTHCNAMNEARWAYFDPYEHRANGFLWAIYRPKPWQIIDFHGDPFANMEVVLKKRSLEEMPNA